MSKLKKGLFLAGTLILSSNLFAADLVIKSSKVKDAINTIKSSDLDYQSEVYRVKGRDTLVDIFDKIDGAYALSKNGYLQVNRNYEYDGQCVSFAKAMTNKSGSLVAERPLTRFSNVSFGTFIATFDKNENYNHKHAAILIRIDSVKGAVLLDQNWLNGSPNNDLGTVGFHYLPFSGTGNYQTDAGAYHIVQE